MVFWKIRYFLMKNPKHEALTNKQKFINKNANSLKSAERTCDWRESGKRGTRGMLTLVCRLRLDWPPNSPLPPHNLYAATAPYHLRRSTKFWPSFTFNFKAEKCWDFPIFLKIGILMIFGLVFLKWETLLKESLFIPRLSHQLSGEGKGERKKKSEIFNAFLLFCLYATVKNINSLFFFLH